MTTALVFLGIAGHVPFFVIAPAYAPPPGIPPEQVSDHVSEQLDIHFEDKIDLLGYRVESTQARPDGMVWVALCWRGTRQMDEDYTVFVQLLVDGELIAAQKDTYHGLGTHPTSLWSPGIVFCERYPLRIKDTVPTSGRSALSIGLYDATGRRLEVRSGSGDLLGDNLRVPGPLVAVPGEKPRLSYHWAHRIALTGYRLDRTVVAPAEAVGLTLNWRALRRMESDYVATVQIMDRQGNKIGQSDLPLSAEGELTSAWVPGTEAIDRRLIAISPTAATGVYDIKIAIYEPATVENLILYRGQEVVPGGGLLDLWTLRISGSSP